MSSVKGLVKYEGISSFVKSNTTLSSDEDTRGLYFISLTTMTGVTLSSDANATADEAKIIRQLKRQQTTRFKVLFIAETSKYIVTHTLYIIDVYFSIFILYIFYQLFLDEKTAERHANRRFFSKYIKRIIKNDNCFN